MQRGLYAKINLKKGEILTDKNTYLAFPLQKKQFPANEVKEGMMLKLDVKKDQPIFSKIIKHDDNIIKDLEIWSHIHNVKEHSQ